MKIATLLSIMLVLINGQTRIISGVEAQVGEHRYVAGIVRCVLVEAPHEYNGGFCAGSLIAPNAFLTAAHCIQNNALYFAIVGSHFILSINNPPKDGEIVYVDKAIRHPLYNAANSSNDAALLLLKKRSNDPTLPSLFHKHSERHFCYGSGWGFTEQNTPLNVRLELPVNTLSRQYMPSNLISRIDATMLPVKGGIGEGICRGDSGGPLTIEATGSRAKLAGIASHFFSDASQRCAVGFPAVFGRVSAFRDFIKSHCKESSDKCIPCTDCDWTGLMTPMCHMLTPKCKTQVMENRTISGMKLQEDQKLRLSMKAREVHWMIIVTDMSIIEALFPIFLLTVMMVQWTFTASWLIPKMNVHQRIIRL
jgi:secreted trypsin-like serine protease